MTFLILALICAPILAAGTVMVLLLRHLVGLWTGRDVMERFRPVARHVSHTERLLHVTKLPDRRNH